MTDNQNGSDIVARAQALVDQVQQKLADGDQFYRDEGLDPQKVRSVLDGHMGAKEWDSANSAFKADMDAVEQEVREEQARLSFNGSPAAGAARRPRPMV